MSSSNYLGLVGIDFVEFSSANPDALHKLFTDFGFSRVMRHKEKKIDYYRQNDIHFFLNYEPNSFSSKFNEAHGPCISSMGWRVVDRDKAKSIAVERGAKAGAGDYDYKGSQLPSIYGIGESLIYFVDDFNNEDRYKEMGFEELENPDMVPSKGFIAIDHLTNNVTQGTMKKWSDFYKEIFGFTEVRYFDIRGQKTGLLSYALQSPCRSFCIPINEGTEDKSQINEYLDEYKGPGIQHLAFITHDIVQSLQKLDGTQIETLNITDDYYEGILDRVPNVTEDLQTLKKHQILVDGDLKGYLLQIFTKNVVGPIFIEIIQRKNHFNFGEGNFGALFKSIELDQEERGYL